MIHTYKGITPTVHPTVFLADGCRIIGDVVLEKDCSVWFNAVIRGDVHYIRIGERTNIQDNAVVHVTHQKFPCIIGSNVTIGHGAIVHAANVKEHVLIGMGAVVLDNAVIEPYSLVAAGAVVPEGFVVPEGSLVAGIPARVKRALTAEERKGLERSSQNYIDYVKTYREIQKN